MCIMINFVKHGPLAVLNWDIIFEIKNNNLYHFLITFLPTLPSSSHYPEFSECYVCSYILSLLHTHKQI